MVAFEGAAAQQLRQLLVAAAVERGQHVFPVEHAGFQVAEQHVHAGALAAQGVQQRRLGGLLA